MRNPNNGHLIKSDRYPVFSIFGGHCGAELRDHVLMFSALFG